MARASGCLRDAVGCWGTPRFRNRHCRQRPQTTPLAPGESTPLSAYIGDTQLNKRWPRRQISGRSQLPTVRHAARLGNARCWPEPMACHAFRASHFLAIEAAHDMDEHAGGRSGKLTDDLLDALREACLQRDALALELGLMKAEAAIQGKRKAREKA